MFQDDHCREVCSISTNTGKNVIMPSRLSHELLSLVETEDADQRLIYSLYLATHQAIAVLCCTFSFYETG